MKRKIIQMAGKTMVVSIPIDIVKKYNLKKGQELEVTEDNGKVSVFIEYPMYKQPCQINMEGHMVQDQLESLYTRGYDEIKVLYKNKNTLKTIMQSLNRKLSGFEILEANNNYCIIKSVMKEDDTKLQSLMRRMFLILLSLLEEYDEVSMENLVKLASMCKRRICLKDYRLDEAVPMYNFITSVEDLGLTKCKNTKMIKYIIEQIYEVYYKFEESKFIKIKRDINAGKNRAVLKKDVNEGLFFYNAEKLLSTVPITNLPIKS